MRDIRWLALVGVLGLLLAGCGGGDGDNGSELSEEAEAACTASELSEAPKLPAGWPDVGEVTFTQQSTEGPTEVVEGYFEGDIQAAHDDFKRELEAAGFTILFDEVEENDSEVSWEGEGRSGQVAIRNECGDDDKMYVKVTNRPAS
jgi:ABC-type glycerol-3-phosphate transport system substrate-binding protein